MTMLMKTENGDDDVGEGNTPNTERARNNEMCVESAEKAKKLKNLQLHCIALHRELIFLWMYFSELHFTAFFVDLGFHTLNSASCLVNFFSSASLSPPPLFNVFCHRRQRRLKNYAATYRKREKKLEMVY